MVIISKVTYPPESAKDMAERFLNAPAPPDYMKRTGGPYIGADIDDGISTISIWEVEEAQLAGGMKFLGNFMAGFFGVPGFNYTYRVWLDIDEALPMIGMA